MRDTVESLLAAADIQVGGSRPWDISVHHPGWYQRVWDGWNLGLGESYMDGWWDCPQLDAFFARLLGSGAEERLKVTPALALRTLIHRLFNFQTLVRAKEVAFRHYDLGNDLFQAMLDPTMTYSCGYWRGAETLEQAQRNKMDLVCAKLMLEPGMRLLDIGCGWGALARHAAERYGAQVVGVTLSEPQRQYAEAACRGLPVSFRLQDYRSMPPEPFDRIVSIGMFEHVGHRNHAVFMDVVHRHLARDGVFLLHTIGGGVASAAGDPWIAKYIFPNGEVPSVAQVSRVMQGRFVMEDWHNFGADYDPTLMAWYRNFAGHWAELQDRLDHRFFRMWRYYLLSCAGAFRARSVQLWQIVLSKAGVTGGFRVRDLREDGAALAARRGVRADLSGGSGLDHGGRILGAINSGPASSPSSHLGTPG
jgi:cyclopropane-fatty-acyl-phospholipid synthase